MTRQTTAALFESPKAGFILSPDDYAACLAASARHYGFGPRGLALCAACAAIVVFVVSNAAWPDRVTTAIGVGAAAFAIGALVSATWRRALVRRWTPPTGPITVSVDARTDQLVVDVDGLIRRYDWIEAKEVVRAPLHLVIMMRAAPPIIVPLAAFGDATGGRSFARFVDQRAINAEDNARDAANPNAPD